METQRNHTRTTGAQDHRTTPQQATRSKTDTPEGFFRQLETTRGKYTLLIIKCKYEGARHVKQAYNNRLTIQAQKENHNRRNANYIYNILIFAKKYQFSDI